MNKILPFPDQPPLRKLSVKKAEIEAGRSTGSTDWALVDQKTRRGPGHHFLSSSKMAQLWQAMTGTE